MLSLDKTQFKQYLSTKGSVEKFPERKLQTTEINHIHGIKLSQSSKIKRREARTWTCVRMCARVHTRTHTRMHAYTLTHTTAIKSKIIENNGHWLLKSLSINCLSPHYKYTDLHNGYKNGIYILLNLSSIP